MKRIIGLILLCVLLGCATQQKMIHPDGREAICEVEASEWMTVGQWNPGINDCIRSHEAQGFKAEIRI